MKNYEGLFAKIEKNHEVMAFNILFINLLALKVNYLR